MRYFVFIQGTNFTQFIRRTMDFTSSPTGGGFPNTLTVDNKFFVINEYASYRGWWMSEVSSQKDAGNCYGDEEHEWISAWFGRGPFLPRVVLFTILWVR